MTLGEYLKKCRGERTLGQISEYSDIDKGYLSKIERNERKPKPEMLLKLSEAYKTDYIELMTLCGYIAKTADSTPPNKKDPPPLTEEDILRMLAEVKNLSDDEVAHLKSTLKIIDKTHEARQISERISEKLNEETSDELAPESN